MAIGGVWDHRAAADLLTLTQIDPSAYLVAAPGFVEIVTDGSEDPEFLSQLAIRLLRDYDWISWHPVPLVSGLFGQSHAWLDLFESSHRNASRAIRGGDPDLTGLAELVDSLRRGVKAEAIQAVARDLLAVSVPLVQDGLAAVTAFPAGLQHLPEAATPLIEIHGRDHVSRALLIVKLIHNIALTLEAVGHPQAKDEAVLFADLLRRQPETTA
jgi:hypothetical protein